MNETPLLTTHHEPTADGSDGRSAPPALGPPLVESLGRDTHTRKLGHQQGAENLDMKSTSKISKGPEFHNLLIDIHHIHGIHQRLLQGEEIENCGKLENCEENHEERVEELDEELDGLLQDVANELDKMGGLHGQAKGIANGSKPKTITANGWKVKASEIQEELLRQLEVQQYDGVPQTNERNANGKNCSEK